jgi:putative transposase
MSMYFKESHLFHVFNRGNNRETVFYNKQNYEFFIQKIEKHISPYADILAWCLMPNHFHLMIEVLNRDINGCKLNDAIGIALRSYAKAINIQEHRVGSLFQSGTKAQNLTNPKGKIITSRNYFYGPAYIFQVHKSMYPMKCMEYIHENPVKAGLVKEPSQWRYSSYNEYLGKGFYRLCNKRKGRRYLSFTR